jgi:D-alanyl-lipoteichoic acid acyltransferase DltB (MBOAT superfamily)
MAIGIAKLFGIKLSQNFSTPYFSRDIAEFWRRWHISLSTWFRDYLYIPLGGSRVSKFFQYRNLILVFLVSGLWHGANWTFIFWGLIHVTFYLPQLINKTNRNYLNIFDNNKTTTIIEYLRIVKTFILVSFAWIFFRSNSIELAINYIKHIFLNKKISIENSFFIIDNEINNLLFVTLMIIIMLIIEWYNRGKEHGYSRMPKNIIIRHFSYIITCLLIIEYFYGEISFIYFQF